MQGRRAQNAQELQAARERVAFLQAADHTIHGVIQDCDFWLEKLPPEPGPEPQPAAAPEAAAETSNLLTMLGDRKARRTGAREGAPA